MGLKLQDVPAAAGMRWVVLALGEFRRYPLVYAGLFAAYLFALALMLLLPLVGGIVLLMAPPLLTLAFMLAVHASVRGERPSLDTLFSPWRRRLPDTRRRLFALLLFYAALMAASFWVMVTRGGEDLDNLAQAYRKSDLVEAEMARLLNAPGVVSAMLWGGALISLVSVLFWFAPALVYWARQGPAQAVFSSVLAMWRARWAFVNYGVFWIALQTALGFLGAVIAAIAGATVSTLLTLPVQLTLTCAFYVSLYFSFRDCFGEPD